MRRFLKVIKASHHSKCKITIKSQYNSKVQSQTDNTYGPKEDLSHPQHLHQVNYNLLLHHWIYIHPCLPICVI